MQRILAATLLLACSIGARAQRPLFDRVTAADGLAGDEVFCLLEDHDGFIWAGTATGLSRLEGTRIRNFYFDPSDSTSLANDQVNSIAQDGSGDLWLATMNGLSRFHRNTGHFTTYRIPATGTAAVQANRLRQVNVHGDTLVWVLTDDGLYRFDARKSSFEHAQGRPAGEGPAGWCRSRNALHWDNSRKLLWVATVEGMAAWDARTDRWSDARAPSLKGPWRENAEATAPMVQGDTLWFHTNDGFQLVAFSLKDGSLTRQAPIATDGERFNLQWQAIDADGRHWLSTWTRRVFHRAGQSAWSEVVASSTEPGAMPSSSSAYFLSASNGDRWLATARGIAVLRADQRATTLHPVPTDSDVSVLLPLGNDTLLAGTARGLQIIAINSMGEAPKSISRDPPTPGRDQFRNYIKNLHRASDGRIAACTREGFTWFDSRDGRMREGIRLSEAPDRIEPGTTFMAEAVGARWIGTWRQGLWRCPLDEKTPCERIDTTAGPHGKLPGTGLLCWLTDAQGRHWVGLNDGGGIARFEDGRWRAVQDAQGRNIGGVVRVIAEGPDGRLWLGTNEQGIVVYDPSTGTSHYVTRRDGVPGARIVDLRFVSDGTLWVIADQGIASMAPGSRALVPFALPAGLQERGAVNAMALLPDGRLAFSVRDRIVLHDPHVPTRPEAAPKAILTGHRVRDAQAFGPPPSLQLESASKALTLEFGAISARWGAPLLFRYRVRSIDTAWKSIGAAQRIDLFDLPSGKHEIEVSASHDALSWSATPALAQVEVLPPFHATWWFRAASSIVLILLTAIAFRIYLAGRLRKQREAFEREQAVLRERERIASDMHDDLGAGLSGLKLRSEMALRVEKDPAKREQLASLAASAGEIIGSMRQMIWAMDDGQSTVHDLLAYATSYARSYCEQNNLSIDVRLAEGIPDARLTSQQRRNIFLVLKEALHNCVKHAQANRVDLHVEWENGLRMRITDDGIGLPKAADAGTGNGMRNMRKRVEDLHGRFEVHGDGGTTLSLHVPIQRPAL